jgi:Lipocalin-like domain
MKSCAQLLLWTLALLSAAPRYLAAGESSAAVPAAQRDLVGAWRLVSIAIEGPGGSQADPFYNSVASGLLIYDPSGSVSVQIVGTPRPEVAVPSSRAQVADDAHAAQLKAMLLDTYYAYFGTWEYDPQTSTVTHKVRSSLYPGEAGVSYAQHVQLSGSRLVFSRTLESTAGNTVQKKVWERIDPGSLPVK